MEPIDEKKLTYTILHGHSLGRPGDTDAYNRIYEFWEGFWREVMAQVGADEGPKAEEFTRQSIVTAIEYEGQVVGSHCYSLYDLALKSHRRHGYLTRYYSEEFLSRLEDEGMRHMMTMEFFSMDKNWRASKVGMSLALVLAGLALKIADSLSVDGVITAARADVGAARIARGVGAEALTDPIHVHGVETELMLFRRENWAEPSPFNEKRVLRVLWEKRLDYGGLTVDTRERVA